ncbi:hypothetical protein LZF96_13290 [Streptomyces sp. ST2-7A]|nr:hypothetical protein [Streptomyces sp. ST2-7A]
MREPKVPVTEAGRPPAHGMRGLGRLWIGLWSPSRLIHAARLRPDRATRTDRAAAPTPAGHRLERETGWGDR